MASNADDCEVIIAVDSDDKASQQAASEVDNCTVVIQDNLPGTCVKGWNLAAKHSSGRILIAISDDFFPLRNWDSRILSVGGPSWTNDPHVLMVNDGYVQDLCTLAIVTRPWYEKLGYLFNPEYTSMYCDTELTYHALQEGALIKALHLVFPHHHPDNGMRPRDNVDLVHSNSDRYHTGKVIFERRKSQKFQNP